ncbi:unnamed protein product [Urochloa decumbens]|uniref:FBD domain-containing protein n=1 Tax=Urochloa decumbens TaxID=240449 RepID=A0ABC9FVM7_9POAL
MAAGVACDFCREDQLETECCRGGLLPRSAAAGLAGLLPLPDGEEDRISALPDDMLLQILARLGCARAAAHTGLLARRWRGLWARLPEFTFHHIAPSHLDAALAMVARPAPSILDIQFNHHRFEPARVSSLLRAAAALAPAEFVLCVAGATQPGGFPALESLHLENGHIDGADMLPLCPRLRKLWALDWKSDSVVLHSEALEDLAVYANRQIRHINIVAPAVKKLYLVAHYGIHKEFSLSFSAPAVEDLTWKCESKTLQRLKVTLDAYEMGDACYADCRCDQPNNWRSQSISLISLKEIEVRRCSDHEVDLLKILLRCATGLKRVTLRFSRKYPPSDHGLTEIDGILKAYPYVKCNIYH